MLSTRGMPMRTRAALLGTTRASCAEGPRGLDALDAEEALLDDDVLHGRALGGHRGRLVEVAERELRLVVDEVGELLGDLLALGDEREHRLLALDGALLAGEAGDVAAGRAVGRFVSMKVRLHSFGQK
jgi:hypothetical protein